MALILIFSLTCGTPPPWIQSSILLEDIFLCSLVSQYQVVILSLYINKLRPEELNSCAQSDIAEC